MKVVVTAPGLVGDAPDFMQRNGVSVVFTGPPATPDDLTAIVSREQPDAIISRTWRLSAETMDAAPNLRLICKHGVGVDNIDVAAATQRKIPVANTPGTNTLSVAELALTLILSVLRAIPRVDSQLRRAEWGKASYRGFELTHRHLGIVGLGAIGRELVRLTGPFGLCVTAFDPPLPDAAFETAGVRRAATLDDLLAEADIISLHCPLTADNRGLIGRDQLARCKPTAILINTARGPLVDTEALVEALREGRLAGAGLDSFAEEPLPPGHPFADLDNVVLTPHVGGATAEGLERVAMTAARTVVYFLQDGRIDPKCIVNPAALTS